ncbi:MAG: aromatic amino acid transport family protein, partial [Cyanobacteria bacterium J06555_13]
RVAAGKAKIPAPIVVPAPTSSTTPPAPAVTDSGALLSSISLVAGTTIGAGILALPAATLPSGLLPSSSLMIAVWLYMAASGFLIVEATLYTRAQLGQEDLGFLATVQHQLGRWGAIAAGTVYIFIHYALLVAYTARGGDILATALTYLQQRFSFSQSVLPLASSPVLHPPVPLWCGHVVFSCLLGSLLFWGSERFVGRLNSILLIIIILAFSGLLTVTIPQIALPQLLRQHWVAVGSAIPVMFVTFVYHSVVPVITTQLNGNRSQIRKAILLGSLIPLSMFLLWNAAILGSVEWTPLETAAENIFDPIETLRMGSAHPRLGLAISVFSELAVMTSFIGFAYGLLSVLNDVRSIGTSVAKTQPRREKTSVKLLSYVLIFVPPLILSLLSPSIFFDAIDASGALGTSFLFGILPAVMVWKLRYNTLTSTGKGRSEPWIPGGKFSLIVMIGIAAFVIVQYILGREPFISF